MKKDIYIIKNDINNKVYIGQTFNIKHRWEQYESAYRKKDTKQLIIRAMLKYGIENFHIAPLEKNVEDYDEREIFWIKFFNSIVPNGYNICHGGQGTGAGADNPNALFTHEEIEKIKQEIKYSTDSFEKISKKYNCESSLISAINTGEAYFSNAETYPIRLSRKSRETIKQVIYALKYEFDKSMAQISKEYNIETSVVNDINQGSLHFIENQDYPLRKGRVFSQLSQFAPKVIELLQHSDLQQKEIAKKFNVSVSWVSSINKGDYYRQDNLKYPIRENYQAKNGVRGNRVLSPNEIKEIEKLLKDTNIGIRKIAEQFDVCYQTISAINIGAVVKYRQEKTQYPLRKLK